MNLRKIQMCGFVNYQSRVNLFCISSSFSNSEFFFYITQYITHVLKISNIDQLGKHLNLNTFSSIDVGIVAYIYASARHILNIM